MPNMFEVNGSPPMFTKVIFYCPICKVKSELSGAYSELNRKVGEWINQHDTLVVFNEQGEQLLYLKKPWLKLVVEHLTVT